jgi:hypothetical protein
LREAAEAGNAVAQYELGRCCYHGDHGVPQNYREAARLLRLAAEQGDADAQFLLASCYHQGKGLPMDESEGLRLLTLASEQGHADSQLTLARYNRATGGPVAAVPREAARSLAHDAQSAIPQVRAAALEVLGMFADDRAFARTCCIGCGKTEQLQVCAKCLTAKFCSRECQQRMWPVHKPACKEWREQKAVAAAEAGRASSSAQAAESGEAEAGEAAAEEEDVAFLPVKELKCRLDRRKISYAGVLERSELVALLEQAAERD